MKQNLSGTWQFALDKDKKGIEQKFYQKTSFNDTIILPTTTAEAKKGEKSTEQNTGYLTEPYHFEGYAWHLKQIEIPQKESGKRFFFAMERTRKTTVWVDGEQVENSDKVYQDKAYYDSFYAEHRYELTKWLTPGTHTLTVLVDNTDYATNGGHMTSPDTQTNWNGIVGEIYLESVENVAIDKLSLYPSRKNKSVDIQLELSYISQEDIFTLNELSLQISCKLTKLEKKANRDFEHFEPIGTQAVQVREEWNAQNKEEDLPYIINTLETLPDKTYPLTQCTITAKDTNTDKKTAKLSITYPLGEHAKEWDEYEPNVYELAVRIMQNQNTSHMQAASEKILCEKTSHFGLRDFTYNELTLYCNDKEIFLRGTHDGLIFPLTGYAPMDMPSWIHVYGTSKEYGLNHYRYHTSCPPKAAFLAASYLGIYIEAELPFWGSIYDPEDENYNKAQQDFLLEEGLRALDAFGDAPSYFGMSMGNELWGSKNAINEMMGKLKAHDNRHLYTQGSNNHQFVPSVLSNDDFFSGVRFSESRLFRGSYAMCDAPLGFVQTKQPGAYWNYDEMILPHEIQKDSIAKDSIAKNSIAKGGTIQIQYGTGIKEVEVADGEEEVIPHVPVISHEIGQYEFTPDFDEITLYTGVLQPENMKIFKERMEEKGLLTYAKDYLAASGKLAAACYKLELEAAFRSANLSGFQLLDIKDYSGQGTALVGILNAFMKNKGAITKENWRMFCSDAVLLPTLDSFVMKGGEAKKSVVKFRYYRPEPLKSTQLKVTWYLKKQAGIKESEQHKAFKKQADTNESLQFREISTQYMDCPKVFGRGLFTLGELELHVPECENNAEYLLRFTLGEDIINEYEIFVYNESAAKNDHYSNNDNICITNDNKFATEECRKGKSVLLFVKPNSMLEQETIQGDYCTDFWCYPMFRSISEGAGKPVPIGTMGLLIDSTHPALQGFVSDDYATAQWYQIVVNARPMILENIKSTKTLKPIVRMMDNFDRNHNLGLIYEGRFHEGKIVICHADLLTLKDQYPEAACLYNSLVDYVSSESFQPQNVLI